MFVLLVPQTCSLDRHGRGPRAKECTNTRRYHASGAKSNALSLPMQAQVTSIDPTDDRQHLRVAAIRSVHWPRHVLVVAWVRVQLRPSRLLCASMGAPATGLQCFDRRFIVKLRDETHWLCAPSWSRPIYGGIGRPSSPTSDIEPIAKPCSERSVLDGCRAAAQRIGFRRRGRYDMRTASFGFEVSQRMLAGHVLKVHVAAHWPSSHGQLCLNSHLCLMSPQRS